MEYSKITLKDIEKAIYDLFYKKQDKSKREVKMYYGPKQIQMLHEVMKKEISNKLGITKEITMSEECVDNTNAEGFYNELLKYGEDMHKALKNMYPGQPITKLTTGNTYSYAEGDSFKYEIPSSVHSKMDQVLMWGTSEYAESYPTSTTTSYSMSKEEFDKKYGSSYGAAGSLITQQDGYKATVGAEIKVSYKDGNSEYKYGMYDAGKDEIKWGDGTTSTVKTTTYKKKEVIEPMHRCEYTKTYGMVANTFGSLIEVDINSYNRYHQDYALVYHRSDKETRIYGTHSGTPRAYCINGPKGNKYYIDYTICTQE